MKQGVFAVHQHSSSSSRLPAEKWCDLHFNCIMCSWFLLQIHSLTVMFTDYMKYWAGVAFRGGGICPWIWGKLRAALSWHHWAQKPPFRRNVDTGHQRSSYHFILFNRNIKFINCAETWSHYMHMYCHLIILINSYCNIHWIHIDWLLF